MLTKRDLIISFLIIGSILTLAYISWSPESDILDTPLRFRIWNYDVDDHEIVIEVFDSSNNTIFNESYLLASGEYINSPELTNKKGDYLVRATLDRNITGTERVIFNEDKRLLIDVYSNRLDFGYDMP